MARERGQGSLWRRGRTWWIQFYENGQRVRMSTEMTAADEAKQVLKEKVARLTLGEPLVVRSARP